MFHGMETPSGNRQARENGLFTHLVKVVLWSKQAMKFPSIVHLDILDVLVGKRV